MTEPTPWVPTEETTNIMAAIQLDLAIKLGGVIGAALVETSERFPDNPGLPHTLVLTCLARTLGQIVGEFSPQQQTLLTNLAVRQMLDQAHQSSIKDSVNPHVQTTFGNA